MACHSVGGLAPLSSAHLPTYRALLRCSAFRLAPGFGLADVSAPADGARAIIGPMVRCMF